MGLQKPLRDDSTLLNKRINKQTWVRLEKFPNYEVHPLLGIRNSKTKKVLKPRYWLGYPRVTLMSDGKKNEVKIHRAVAQTFLYNPNPEIYNVVNHISGDRADHRITNLEWMTQSDNIKDRWANRGLRKKYLPEYIKTERTT